MLKFSEILNKLVFDRMAATMKHRRSSRRKKTTRGADRYDVLLKKVKRIKKSGGSPLTRSKSSSALVPSHRVTPESPSYKGVKVISEK